MKDRERSAASMESFNSGAGGDADHPYLWNCNTPPASAGELVTPTGAAIVAAIRTGEELPEAYRILQIGMGAGKREYETPGILRAMLIEGSRFKK